MPIVDAAGRQQGLPPRGQCQPGLVLSHGPRVVVDLSEVTAFEAAVLEELLVAQDICSAVAADLILRSPSDQVLRAIEVSDAAGRLEIEHPT